MHAAKPQAATNTKRTPVRWSEADVVKLIDLWSTTLSNAEIAKKLNRNEAAVAVKASRINLPRRSTKTSTNSKARIKPCLGCSTPFHSTGPGNRFCDPCKAASDWQNGNDYYATIGGI